MQEQTDTKRPERREAIYVDKDVQSALIRHLVFTWCAIIGIIGAALLAAESINSGYALSFRECVVALWEHNEALLITLTILSPIIVYDFLLLSHRFAGPMVSIRRNLNGLASGEQVPPMRMRKNDFWQDVGEDINKIADRINSLEGKTSSDPASRTETERDDQVVAAAVERQTDRDPTATSQESESTTA